MATTTETRVRPPHGAYATIIGTFVGGLAAAGALARILDRDVWEHTFLDLVTLRRPASRRRGRSPATR